METHDYKTSNGHQQALVPWFLFLKKKKKKKKKKIYEYDCIKQVINSF